MPVPDSASSNARLGWLERTHLRLDYLHFLAHCPPGSGKGGMKRTPFLEDLRAFHRSKPRADQGLGRSVIATELSRFRFGQDL
jgi:hypothetical protein